MGAKVVVLSVFAAAATSDDRVLTELSDSIAEAVADVGSLRTLLSVFVVAVATDVAGVECSLSLSRQLPLLQVYYNH